jgi:ribosomal protein S12 methylthiotransferase accessory factor
MESIAIERPQRVGPPATETLAKLMSWLDAIGITRVADLTGLDRLGIPVMQAVRPSSLSNAVSQGKGGDATAAAISAILESAEARFAESASTFDVEVASANTLRIARGRFDKHLLADAPPAWRDGDIGWVKGTDLLADAEDFLPFELVHTAYVTPALPYHGVFASSTTGLAAALAEEDATAHAILECIERDAIARAHRVHGFFHRHRLDPTTIDDPGIRELLDHLTEHGMLAGLWHAPSPTGVPVIWCHLIEAAPTESALLPMPADGSAARLDPADAIRHAIYEAAQARLAAISGARDDITRASYPKYPDRVAINAHRRLLAEGPRTIAIASIAGRATALGGGGLEGLISALDRSGISSALTVRIDTRPLAELSVVRVVIPDLEPLLVG